MRTIAAIIIRSQFLFFLILLLILVVLMPQISGWIGYNESSLKILQDAKCNIQCAKSIVSTIYYVAVIIILQSAWALTISPAIFFLSQNWNSSRAVRYFVQAESILFILFAIYSYFDMPKFKRDGTIAIFLNRPTQTEYLTSLKNTGTKN